MNQGLAVNHPDRIGNRDQWQQNRQSRRDEVWGQVAANPQPAFWTGHANWSAYNIQNPYNPVAWGALAGWIGASAAQPTPYGYGDNVYYQNNNVYYGDQQAATSEAYAQQAATLAGSAPDVNPQESQWLPLGVFAFTQDGQASGSKPSLYMQLAISKEAVISGTMKHAATGQVQDMEGMADKKTQRAAWGVKGQSSPIIEAGLSNLTQDTVPTLLHFANGQTQQWLMIRLPDPKQGQ